MQHQASRRQDYDVDISDLSKVQVKFSNSIITRTMCPLCDRFRSAQALKDREKLLDDKDTNTNKK